MATASAVYLQQSLLQTNSISRNTSNFLLTESTPNSTDILMSQGIF